MDKFSQQLKNNLENQPYPDYEPGDWIDMQQRLDSRDKPAKYGYRLLGWGVATILLFLIGSNWFLFKELKSTNQTIQKLMVSRDTIRETKVIYQIDTVYISKETSPRLSKKSNSYAVVEKHKDNTDSFNYRLSPYNRNSNLVFNDYNYSLFSDKITSFSWSNILNKYNITTDESKSGMTKNTRTKLSSNNSLTPISMLPSLPFSLISSLEEYNIPIKYANITNKKKKTFAQYLYPLKPKGIEIGLFAGTSIAAASGYDDFHTFERGALVNIKFSNSWRLWSSAYLTTIGYKSEKMGENGIPEIQILNDDWETEDIKVNRKTSSFDIGLQYNFRSQKSLQPFVGLGYGVSSMLQNDVRYEFENEITDEHFFEERNFSKESQLEFWILRKSIKYQLRKWSFALEGMYRYRVNNANGHIPNEFSARLNLLYNF